MGIQFGIIKERKNPPDRRVVLSPDACKKVVDTFENAEILVEPSDLRVFKDQEYEDKGLPLSTNMNNCDVLIGVKEVPVAALIPYKKYIFFSHTIKKQLYNKKLLQAILDKRIELYDHEVLTNAKEERLVSFGRYAGIVGAYNGFRALGLKQELFKLPRATNSKNQEDLVKALQNIKPKLPVLKILLTGTGKVGNGAKEMLDALRIRKVTVNEYLKKEFQEPVYCQIDVTQYNQRKDGVCVTKADFFKNPEAYTTNFTRFTKVTDFYIAGHFYASGAPALFTKEAVKQPNFKIKIIADISCDINGPIPTTLRSATIADPFYGYDPKTGKEVDFKNPTAIAVMAVDNLPCELPRDASIGFGDAFVREVIPAFFTNDKNGILERARITKNGALTRRYAYLQDYVSGKQ